MQTDKFGTSVTFDKDQIKNFMTLARVNNFSVYTNPDDYNKSKPDKTEINSTPSDFIINLNTPLGIANFKLFMEDVLLKILGRHGGNDLNELLKVGRTSNIFGVKGTSIMPSFKITNKNIPNTAEKIYKLERAFNDLDFSGKKELQLTSGMN